MPTALDVADVDIPSSSEIHGLLRESPDIEALLFRDGEYLVRENDGAKDIFIVLQGSYVVEQAREGSGGGRPAETLAVVVNTMDAPSFVGEMAYLGEGVRTASVRNSGATHPSTVRTETAACLVVISADSKLAVIRNFPELILRLYEERAN